MFNEFEKPEGQSREEQIADRISPARKENLSPTTKGNIRTPAKFVNDKDTGESYMVITTPRGQEVKVKTTNPLMSELVSQLIDNQTDTEQAMFSMDLAERVMDSLQNRGIEIEDGHEKAIDYLNGVITKWIQTEKLVKTGKQLKFEEAVLDSMAFAVRLPKKEFNKLNEAIQEATRDAIQGVALAALSDVADESIVETAQNLLGAHNLLMKRKTDLALMRGEALGGFFGGLLGTGAEKVVTPLTRVIFGEQKSTGGIAGALKDTSGEIIEGIVNTTGEKIDSTIKWAREQRKK